MFVIAKKNFLIPRAGEKPYIIKKDFVGEIPEDVAGHWLVQAAIKSGSIATPKGKKDKELENADKEAKEKAEKADIRSNEKKEKETGESKT